MTVRELATEPLNRRDVLAFFLGIAWAALASGNRILVAIVVGAGLLYYLLETAVD